MWIGIAAIIALTLVAYWPAIHGGFIWDDDDYLTSNPHLNNVDGLVQLWKPGTTKQFYPVVFTTFWLETHIWGLNPLGYHLVNVLLHALNVTLVWGLCRRLRIPGAWLIAAVFAVHPVHVESVAWITERKNVLSACFYLLAARSYLRFDEAVQTREAASGSWRWYCMSLILLVLALLSKSVTCSLPAALILMMLYQHRGITIKRLMPLAPMFVIGLALALNTAYLEREHVRAIGPDFDFSLAVRILIASRALLFYPYKILWPHPLMFIYPRWIINAREVSQYVSLLGIVVLTIACVFVYRRGWRGPPLALAFYAGTIVPALGFFNVYPMLFSFVADHFQYLASLGIIACVIGGLSYWLGRSGILYGVAAIMLATLSFLTHQQSRIYVDAEHVWRDTLMKNERAWMAHNNLASLLIRQASAAREQKNEAQVQLLAQEAMAHADAALTLRTGHMPALSNRSEALRLLGRYEDALAAAQEMLQQNAMLAENHWMTGRLLHLLKRYDDAVAEYSAALQRDPNHGDARDSLTRLLLQLGDDADKAGKYRDALDHYEHAWQAAGNDPGLLVHSGYRLSKYLATCPDMNLRDGPRAAGMAEQLCRITNRTNPQMLDVLAAAYAQTGRFEDAARTCTEALALARSLKLVDLSQEIAIHCRAYGEHKPPSTSVPAMPL